MTHFPPYDSLPSHMESYTPQEHDRAWGDGIEEDASDALDMAMQIGQQAASLARYVVDDRRKALANLAEIKDLIRWIEEELKTC